MVFFLEDPLTGDTPHREIIEEEDEQQATELAPQYSAAPTVQVRPPLHVSCSPLSVRSARWLGGPVTRGAVFHTQAQLGAVSSRNDGRQAGWLAVACYLCCVLPRLPLSAPQVESLPR